MKFSDVLNATSWDEIQKFYLRSHYFRRNTRSPRLRKKIIKKFHAVYSDLLQLSSIQTDMRLKITKEADSTYVDVSGLDGTLHSESEHYSADIKANLADQEIYYSIVNLEWGKWLGLKIDAETLNSFSKTEIAAHSIWEMTYLGFTQEVIKSSC